MEQDRKCRDLAHATKITSSMTKEARVYNGENTVSSMSGAVKIGQLYVK